MTNTLIHSGFKPPKA